MDKLYTTISKLLSSSTDLIQYSDLTQSQVGKPDVVLWNNEPSQVDKETYSEFKDAIKKRSNKYYLSKHVMSYPDFCISLICCTEYSLNHKVAASIPDRAFSAAWRTIGIVADTSTSRVCSWLKQFVAGRTCVGYCNALGLPQDNIVIYRESRSIKLTWDNSHDVDLMSSVPIGIKATKIGYYENSEDTSDAKVFQSTTTPEGQLYSLVCAASILNNEPL